MKLSPEFAQITFWLALATCVIAQFGVLRSTARGLAVRSRTAESEGQAAAAAARVKLIPEIVWAIVPAIALIFVFLASWQAIERVAQVDENHSVPQPPPPLSDSPSLYAVVESPAPQSQPKEPTQPRLRKPRAKVVALEKSTGRVPATFGGTESTADIAEPEPSQK